MWLATAALVLCGVDAALGEQPRPLYRVSGTTITRSYYNGPYAPLAGGGYRKLGGNVDGFYMFLYPVTYWNSLFSSDSPHWVMGYSSSETLDSALASYRAPGRRVPARGWEEVSDGSRTGGRSRGSRPDMLVEEGGRTGATEEELEASQGAITSTGGVVCQDMQGAWVTMARDDPTRCDGVMRCKSGHDEKECMGVELNSTEVVVVAGADRNTRGVYTLERSNGIPVHYSRLDGWAFLYWTGQKWEIGEGQDFGSKVATFTSAGDKASIPNGKWDNIGSSMMTNMRVTPSSSTWEQELEQEEVDVEEGITCTRHQGELLVMERDDPRICDLVTKHCKHGRDERSCGKVRDALKSQFLLVTGADKIARKNREGMYDRKENKEGKAAYYKHMDTNRTFLYRTGNSWSLGDGDTVEEATAHFKSPVGINISTDNWEEAFDDTREGKKRGVVEGMQVISLPSSINRTQVVSGKEMKVTAVEEDEEDGVLCLPKIQKIVSKYQRLFIKRSDDATCDGNFHCKEGGDEWNCVSLEGEDFSQFLLVTGAPGKDIDGVYEKMSKDGKLAYYQHMDTNTSFIYSSGTNRTGISWTLGRGESIEEAQAYYKSEINNTIPEENWAEASDGSRVGIRRDNIKGMKISMLPQTISRDDLVSKKEVRIKQKGERVGVICFPKVDNTESKYRRLFITASSDQRCDGTWDCGEGGDELNCGNLAENAFWPPMAATILLFVLSCITECAVKNCKVKKGKRMSKKLSKPKKRSTQPEVDKIVDICIRSIHRRSNWQNEADRPPLKLSTPNFNVLYNISGGLRQLIEVGKTFLKTPEERHSLGERVKERMIEKHSSNEEMVIVLREKVGSNDATAWIIQNMSEPNCIKLLKHNLWDLPVRHLQAVHVCVPILVGSLFPLVKVALFTFDYFKDIGLDIYLLKQSSVMQPIILFLVGLFTVSIAASSILMCVTVQAQENNGIINISQIESTIQRRLLRTVLVGLTPMVPITIIFKQMRLSMEKMKLVANWRMSIDTSSTGTIWRKIRSLESEATKTNTAFSKLKIAEVNLEGITQVFIIASFFCITKTGTVSNLGAEFEKNWLELGWTSFIILVCSPIWTIFTNIDGAISYVNNGKKNQLGMKSKIPLGLAFLFQIAARFLTMVPVVLAGLIGGSLAPTHAMLLLAVPFIIHGVALILTMPTRISRAGDRMDHLVANVWLTIYPRLPEDTRQENKGGEQLLMNLLMGANILLTSAATALLMKNTGAAYDFLLNYGLPAIVCHILGGLCLVGYYKFTHTFHLLGAEREGRCCFLSRLCNPGEPMVEEVPYWQVQTRRTHKWGAFFSNLCTGLCTGLCGLFCGCESCYHEEEVSEELEMAAMVERAEGEQEAVELAA